MKKVLTAMILIFVICVSSLFAVADLQVGGTVGLVLGYTNGKGFNPKAMEAYATVKAGDYDDFGTENACYGGLKADIGYTFNDENEAEENGFFFDVDYIAGSHTGHMATSFKAYVVLPQSKIAQSGLYTKFSIGTVNVPEDSDDFMKNGYNGVLGSIELFAPKKNGKIKFSTINSELFGSYVGDSSFHVSAYATAGYLYSFDKDPTVSGMTFDAFEVVEFAKGNNVKAAQSVTLHTINDKICAEDFSTNLSLKLPVLNRAVIIGGGVGFNYSYDNAPEANGVNVGSTFRYVDEVNKFIFEGLFGVALHRIGDNVKMEVSAASADAKLGFVGLKADYVYRYNNDADENGSFFEVALNEGKDLSGSFNAEFHEMGGMLARQISSTVSYGLVKESDPELAGSASLTWNMVNDLAKDQVVFSFDGNGLFEAARP